MERYGKHKSCLFFCGCFGHSLVQNLDILARMVHDPGRFRSASDPVDGRNPKQSPGMYKTL